MPLDKEQQQLVLMYDATYILVGDGTAGKNTSQVCIDLNDNAEHLQQIKELLKKADNDEYNNLVYGEALTNLKDLIEMCGL